MKPRQFSITFFMFGGYMAEVQHFAYGSVNPILAFVLSFLGSLLSLVLARRARDARGGERVRFLALSALSLGGTGIWLMHFMAMVGFDVPESPVRYDLPITVVSFAIAVVIVAVGLFTAVFTGPGIGKILVGGFITGVGVAAMHYTGMLAMRVTGKISFDVTWVVVSVAVAVVASTIALWFATVIRGASATVGASFLMAIAVCSMHYTGMLAIRVRLTDPSARVHGLQPFDLLLPIAIIASVMIMALAYATVGAAPRQEAIDMGTHHRRFADRV
jgi:NO-binding membrane sensor protein with MHYT domain